MMPLLKFESMLKTNDVYFFDLAEFEEIIVHYFDSGKHSLAKKAIKLGLEQHPSSIDLKILKVELLVFENKLEKASKLIKKLEVLDKSNEEIFIQKANINSKSGLHEIAILNLKKALVLTDDKNDVLSLLGMEYLLINDFKNAQKTFIKSLEFDLEDYAALHNLIYCFNMNKNHHEAVGFLKTYIDKNPYCEVAWHQLGKQYLEIDDLKNALLAFDYSVIIDEEFVGGYLEKAKVYELQKNYKAAIENYVITLNLDDATAFVYFRIGTCFKAMKNIDESIVYFKKSIHEDPILDKAWFGLASSYFEKEDYQKAAYYSVETLKIDDSNPIYWRKYSEISLHLNLFEEAITGFKKCLNLGDRIIEIYLALSDIHLFLGDFQDAITVLELASEEFKEHSEIEYRLCGAHFKINNEYKGAKHLIKGLHINSDSKSILTELFPEVSKNEKIQKIIFGFQQL